MLECLTGLVGLTDMDCPCFTADQPTDFAAKNASSTGFYLTDTDWGFPFPQGIFAGIDCGDPSNIFSVLEKARTAAMRRIATDTPLAMNAFHNEAMRRFDGVVGKLKFSGVRALSSDTAGQVWRMKAEGRKFKDVTFTVTAIWAAFNQTGTIGVSIGSNAPDWTGLTVTLNTEAGKMVKTDLTANNIVLPMWNKYAERGACCDDCGLAYAFSYPLATGWQPMQNTYKCCGSNPAFERYFSADGFDTSDAVSEVLDKCPYGLSSNNQANGIVVEGYFSCDSTQWMCELDKFGSYNANELLGRTIQHAANVYLANHLLKSSNVNYWTVLKLNQELLYKIRSKADKHFKENIAYMAKHMPNGSSGCWECKPSPIQRKSF